MSYETWVEHVDGVSTLRHEVTHLAWSPDDALLAVALGPLDDAGRTVVVVLDVAEERPVFTVRGAAVLGLGWSSPELLVVVRSQAQGGRAVTHAVPDGAVLGSVALPAMYGGGHTLSTDALSGAATVLAVLPRQWHGGPAQRARRRVGYVLRTEPFEVLRELAPSEWSVAPALPMARPTVAALDPDGARITVWLGEPAPDGAPGAKPGHLASYAWRDGRATLLARAGRAVVEVIPCDPTRVLLRESARGDAGERGDVTLVDTERGVVLRETADGPDEFGPEATVDLHPDRERALVAGRMTRGGRLVGSLRAIDLVTGVFSGPAVAVTTAAERVMGAVWADDSDAVYVLASRGAARARVQRWSAASADATQTDRFELALKGKQVTQGRLAWSPQRTRLTVLWRCVPTKGDAAARTLGVTRVAWWSASSA